MINNQFINYTKFLFLDYGLIVIDGVMSSYSNGFSYFISRLNIKFSDI